MPKIIGLPNNWAPRSYQQAFWDYLELGGLRAIEIAHRRWGKDEVVLHRSAVAAFERVGNYWHCLPEYEQARKAIWNAVNPHTGLRRIDEAFPPELRETKDEQQMFIRFKNGSTWQVIGSDRYNSLVGAGVAGVVFSEWALANPSSWGYIRPMIEENRGWAAFITTPRGRNHAYAMYEMAQKSPNWFAETSNIHATGALSEQQIEEALAEYQALYGEDFGKAQFEQEYLCSWNAAILGAFYALEMARVRAEGRIREIIPFPGRPIHRAWDIGVRDDTSIWWFQTFKDAEGRDRIYILDCYTNHGAGVDHYAEVVHSKPWAIEGAVDFVPHDARATEWGTGRTRIESMQAHGLRPHVVPDVSKLDGINAVRKTLPLCVFSTECEVGIQALEQYRREWDDDRKMFAANETRDWTTHLADAFRYLSVAWRAQAAPGKAKEPKPKAGQVLLEGPPKPKQNTRIKF